MVDRAVPDGTSSDAGVAWLLGELEPEDLGAAEVLEEAAAEEAAAEEVTAERGPVTPYNKGIMASLNDVQRGMDHKLYGHDGSVPPRWYTLNHEGDPDLEYWSDASVFRPAGLTADDWVWGRESSRTVARTMDSLAVEDGKMMGYHLRDGLWDDTYILLHPGDPKREIWQRIAVLLHPGDPLVPGVPPLVASAPATKMIGGIPVVPMIGGIPVPIATTASTSSGTVHLGSGTLSIAPLPKGVPDGTTSEKPTQINFRSDTEMKRRLRLAAAKADMKVGEYVEHLLKIALAEIEATEAECAGADVLDFEFEVVATPAAERPAVTMDILRNAFKAKGYNVVECHANKATRNPPLGTPWDPSITAPVV